MKLIEKSGTPLSNYFNKNISVKNCPRTWCAVCTGSEAKGPSKCGIKSVVYVGVCSICESVHKANPSVKHKGIYVGQTYRTLAERAKEHRQSFRDLENGSFMFKHWVLEHGDLIEPPKFQFKVVDHHKDPLTRMIHEAVLISEKASLNSKAEWMGYKMARLSIEKTAWETKKQAENDEIEAKNLNFQLDDFRTKVIGRKAICIASNNVFNLSVCSIVLY